MLLRRRTLLTCEREAPMALRNPNIFYILSCDVGRIGCNTALTVIKVIPTSNSFKKNIVYLEVINGENFITDQAPRIKELIERYRPREVVIDANGIGIGLMDAMTIPSVDMRTGKSYPAYYGFNLESHLPPERKNVSEEPIKSCNAIIYEMKANSTTDPEMHANVYTQFSTGQVSLLTSEQIMKDKVLTTIKGRKFDPFELRKYLLPYEMTSRLIDEILNLRLKPMPGGTNQTKVEQINSSIYKDRYSSLQYGLWRVKYYEDKETHRRTSHLNIKDYTFFTPNARR